MARHDPWPHRRNMIQMPLSPLEFPCAYNISNPTKWGTSSVHVTRLGLALAASSILIGENDVQDFLIVTFGEIQKL